MGARVSKGQGKLKFDNTEIYLLLKENKWRCSDCNKEIKKKLNDPNPFSLKDRDNPKWVMEAEKFSLQELADINVKRKKSRGTKGNNARTEDGTLNYDNLLLLCYSCNKKQSKERREVITFRTSKEKKEWLEGLAKDKGMAELMNDIIDKYRNDLDEEFLEFHGQLTESRQN
jgi:hypothetical protein